MCNKNVLTIVFIILTLVIGSLFLYSLSEKYNINNILWMNKGNWKWKDSWAKNNPIDNLNLKKIDISQNLPNLEITEPQKMEGLVLSYDEAVKKSKEINKSILLIFSADWCKYCNRMKNETLNQDKVKEVLNKYIVCYINVDKDPKMGAKFSVKSLPYYVVTNSEEQNLKRNKGFMDADAFVSWLNK